MSSAELEKEPGVRLLVLFDALVRRDVDSPGLEGRVAVGVDETWWRVDFDQGAITEYCEARPDADVQVRMDVRGAERVLTEGQLPDSVEVRGDGALFTQFIKRYTEKRSWLDIRAG